MPTYLAISHDNESKRYLATSAYPTKPYMHVGNDVIPLTTNTTSGLQLKVKIGGQTYRPMEYGSESASASYYTTAEVSEGLSETTALTRVSTSGESYLTRESTSDTLYGTSNEYYLSMSMWRSEKDSVPFYTSFSGYTTQKVSYISYGRAAYPSNEQTYLSVSFSSNTLAQYYTSSSAMHTYMGGKTTSSTIAGNPEVTQTAYIYARQLQRNSWHNVSGYNGNVDTFNTNYWTFMSYYQTTDWDENTTEERVYWTTFSGRNVTTGTTYLTCESTSETVYLTRESTYGYSGISSSSSESSGWQ